MPWNRTQVMVTMLCYAVRTQRQVTRYRQQIMLIKVYREVVVTT